MCAVAERGQSACLALEAVFQFVISREVRGQNLDCDERPEPRIAGTEHHTHTANADLGGNLIRAKASAKSQGHGNPLELYGEAAPSRTLHLTTCP